MSVIPDYIRNCRAVLAAAQERYDEAQRALSVAQGSYAAAVAQHDLQLARAAERAAQGLLTVESDADLASLLNEDPFVPSADWTGYEDWPGDGYGIALAFSKPVADPTHLLAYFCRADLAMGWDGFNGDVAGTPVDLPNARGEAMIWYWSCDMTKSARDDVAYELSHLREFMKSGSPLRKTDRSGPGTKDTRAVDGVGADVQVYVALDY